MSALDTEAGRKSRLSSACSCALLALAGVGAAQAAKYLVAISGFIHPHTRPWEATMLVLTALQAGILLYVRTLSGSRMLRIGLAVLAAVLMLLSLARGLLLLGNAEFLQAQEAICQGNVGRAELAMDRHAARWTRSYQLPCRFAVAPPVGVIQDLRCVGYVDVAHRAIAENDYQVAERCIEKALEVCENARERADLAAALAAVRELMSR